MSWPFGECFSHPQLADGVCGNCVYTEYTKGGRCGYEGMVKKRSEKAVVAAFNGRTSYLSYRSSWMMGNYAGKSQFGDCPDVSSSTIASLDGWSAISRQQKLAYRAAAEESAARWREAITVSDDDEPASPVREL